MFAMRADLTARFDEARDGGNDSRYAGEQRPEGESDGRIQGTT
jgi:hypothetical protein